MHLLVPFHDGDARLVDTGEEVKTFRAMDFVHCPEVRCYLFNCQQLRVLPMLEAAKCILIVDLIEDVLQEFLFRTVTTVPDTARGGTAEVLSPQNQGLPA
jgi:hypothetical protein